MDNASLLDWVAHDLNTVDASAVLLRPEGLRYFDSFGFIPEPRRGTPAADTGWWKPQAGQEPARPDERQHMPRHLSCTPQALRAAADWTEAGDGMADVCRLADGPRLVAAQGDDKAAFGPDGSLAGHDTQHGPEDCPAPRDGSPVGKQPSAPPPGTRTAPELELG